MRKNCGTSSNFTNMPGQALPQPITEVSPDAVLWENPPGTAGCVPTASTLTDFLTWFHKDVTPFICAALPLKDSPGSVITGEGGQYVIKQLKDLFNCETIKPFFDPASATTCFTKGTESPTHSLSLAPDGSMKWLPSATLNCADLIAKIGFQSATSCIPTLVGEVAQYVLSADQNAGGPIAWRQAPALTCDQLGEFLKPSSPTNPAGCFDTGTETAEYSLSITPDGTVKWLAPGSSALDCATLTGLLKPDSASSCFQKGTETPTHSLALAPDGSIKWLSAAAVVSGPGGAITCAGVKTALEGGCIPDGTINKAVGFDAAGGLIKEPKKRLVRIFLQGGGTGIVDDTYTDTLTNHANSANRRVWKWSDWDTARFANAQQYGDASFDSATGDFVIGHDAWYRLGTAIFVGLSSTSTTPSTSVSVLAGFRIERPPLGATEIRFGEITQDLGKSDAIRLPAADYFFSGSISMFFSAGSRIRVRFWAAGGTVPSPSQTVSLRASYPTGSYFSLEELAEYGD